MDQHKFFPIGSIFHAVPAPAAGAPFAEAAGAPSAEAAHVPFAAVPAAATGCAAAGKLGETAGALCVTAATNGALGFCGTLLIQDANTLDEESAGKVLSRLDSLIRWAQAQEARVLHRMENIYRDEMVFPSGKPDAGMAFSLAASEAAVILCVPQTTGQRLMSEARSLCVNHSATLARLEQGGISYSHAQTVLDQSQGVEPEELPAFEAKLLEAAVGQTPSQFRVRARRLREKQYPEGIVERQSIAFEKRKVCLEPADDGMSWLSAFLPAEKAQAIFTQLSKAARGENTGGDPRTVDHLRADILSDLLMSSSDDSVQETRCSGDAEVISRTRTKSRARAKARTEILVLISAETLFGADNQPAELHGYGPISPETARRMARDAARWTPVERNPDTEEILRVGRRRKVPSGLQRWLRARDGTCRFPGCRSNAAISEIDHTKPWAQGGATDHDNLEHLCRRHHMYKTKGFWKACQPAAGIIEWTSPGGRTYRTEPHLSLASVLTQSGPGGVRGRPATGARAASNTDDHSSTDDASNTGDYGEDPPPF